MFLSKPIVLTLMPSFAAFNLGLKCLPKYLFIDSRVITLHPWPFADKLKKQFGSRSGLTKLWVGIHETIFFEKDDVEK